MPSALCYILYPVSAALTSFYRMDYISTSYIGPHTYHAGQTLECLAAEHQEERDQEEPECRVVGLCPPHHFRNPTRL
ncbi:hypothetical protein T484DRAFT_1980507 [Baffinella frigidus]|nr:hypothetical protein T484DRAFT_1980507 [Cryptophyta sp. CCMP2293]